MEHSAPAKCARCSEEITDRQLVYFDHGDLIHVRCLRLSSDLNRVAQQLLDAAQRERKTQDDEPGRSKPQ